MIGSFSGDNSFLNNYYFAEVEYEGMVYPTVEHAYQAAKTIDPEIRKKFLKGKPSQAKWVGNRLPLRPYWDSIKLVVMYEIVKSKFVRNESLRRKLLDTGEQELVEGNTWGDRFWGKVKGSGRNELGKILMQIRTELKTNNG